jgi:hypothetical protein
MQIWSGTACSAEAHQTDAVKANGLNRYTATTVKVSGPSPASARTRRRTSKLAVACRASTRIAAGAHDSGATSVSAQESKNCPGMR